MPQTLEYADPALSETLRVEEGLDGGVTITVPTRRRNFRHVVSTMLHVHVLGFVAAPMIYLLYKAFATRRPRAVVTLTRDELILTETSDDGPGFQTTVVSWPRSEVAEVRPNRYSKGLYLRVPGKQNVDLLTDLPAQTLQTIGEALAAAQARLASRRLDDA
jgi:hypothetical protein